MKKLMLLAWLLVFSSTPAFAAPQTVTLSIPGMTCPTCPLTIRVALKRVEGVQEADVSYEDRQAVVTFDDSETTVQALTDATTNAGFPSTVKKTETDQASAGE